MQLTDEEWRKKLTPEQYKIFREKGTEAPFTGELLENKDTGAYTCAACEATLFMSDAKYDSKIPGLMGWPSFSEVAKSEAVELVDDHSLGMQRVEVVCKNCGGHLGHLFDDSSASTGKHYCINSMCLKFEPEEKKAA